jgi:hypothetical protein
MVKECTSKSTALRQQTEWRFRGFPQLVESNTEYLLELKCYRLLLPHFPLRRIVFVMTHTFTVINSYLISKDEVTWWQIN